MVQSMRTTAQNRRTNTTKNGSSSSSSSWMWSPLAVAIVSCLLYSTLQWHSNSTELLKNSKPASPQTIRLLKEYEKKENDKNNDVVLSLDLLDSSTSIEQDVVPSSTSTDDDYTRDETCRQYLVNFLNGTTDAKDECQGFYNAWKAADCQDDKNSNDIEDVAWHFILDLLGLGRRHRNENGTIVDDDVVMDDVFEQFECCRMITDFYEKHCAQETELDAFKLFGIVAVLVICGFTKSMIRVTGTHWIPDAGACIIVGSIVGFGLRLIDGSENLQQMLTFDHDLFMQVMLPPIIFEAAISIDKRAFRRDLFPILTLAVFGTGFSALAIGYGTYSLSHWGSSATQLPLLDALLFGALMSSIDPVATLSILSGVGVSQGDTLYTLIFGESLLNDGVAIVLFDSLVRHMGDADVVDVATFHDTLRDFVIVTLGSVVVGVLCGAICTFYFYALQGKQSAVTEVAMFFVWSLIPYYLSDGFGFSGIIAIMVMGFMLDYFVIGGFQSDEGEWMEYMAMRVSPSSMMENNLHHPVEPHLNRFKDACARAFSGRGHITSRSRHHVGFVAEVIANLMETAIFAYLGLFLFNDTSFNFKLVGSGLFSCVSSRAVMIIVFSLLINVCVWIDLEGLLGRLWYMVRRQNNRITIDDDSLTSVDKVYLDKKTQLILFSAGIRGAVSYALVQNIPVYDAVTKHGSHFKGELRAMTSATIVVLLFGLGALTYFTVKGDADQHDREGAAGPLSHRLMSGLDSHFGDECLDESSELNSLALEVDAHPRNPRPPTA